MKTFTILTRDGNQEVSGYIVGHLGVHKDYDWRITHLSSGKQVAYGFDKLAEAKGFAESLQQTIDMTTFNHLSVLQLQKLKQAMNKLRKDKQYEN